MISCVRRLQFAAGHRVFGHESKCSHLHGHNYVVMLYAERAAGLDSIGRVIDFSVLKLKFGDWIDKHWDHGFILHADDAMAIAAVKSVPVAGNTIQKLYLMTANPTAENMATHLGDIASPLLLDTGVRLTKVQLWETENCMAEVLF